ncbi:MFS transporter [uncultured Lutibacter sp.]|uniref:MFS transporter n=1 Tax=uncultured Lutibacter sp. TaxID=437739 RepID=UPI002609ABB6|nr:MFS transporter [uncultured Lutibacter sp.]
MRKILFNIQQLWKKSKTFKINKSPILSENALLRYFSFSSLYVAQGIPEGLTFFGIPAWMAINGKSPAEIGSFVAVIGIPWSFKILVAPLMDRFTYLPMGRKRPWVLFGQLGLIVSFFSAAFIVDPLNNLNQLMIAGFFISFFGAFQDVAVDGMAIDIVPINEQARANGLMWGSKTIGTSLSLIASTWIINNYGFNIAVIALSIVVMFIILIPFYFKEHRGEKLLPWTKGTVSKYASKLQLKSWGVIFKSLFKVFVLPTSLLMGVAVFINSIGNGLMDSLLPVFTIQKIGWTNDYYSQIMAIANISSGILGMFVGGALVDFFGKVRMMSVYLILLICLIITMVVFKGYWNNQAFIPGFFIGYYMLYTFLTIAIFAAAMELSWKRISATQFTLFMAISNLGRATGAGLLGQLKDIMKSWDYIILFYALTALIMLILIRWMNFKRHLNLVEHLEKNFIPNS